MTNTTGTEVYDIRVADENGAAIVYGGGNLKVLAYLANAAGKALAERGEAEVTVSVKSGETTLTSFTGDADTAAMVLKGRIAKLRKAAGDTDTAE